MHCVEYAQKTQSAFDKHKYPSEKSVVKAFIPSDWKILIAKVESSTFIVFTVSQRNSQQNSKSPSKSKRTGRMARKSPW